MQSAREGRKDEVLSGSIPQNACTASLTPHLQYAMKAVHLGATWRPLVAAGPLNRRSRPLAFCIPAVADSFSADVLVLDATNILSRAAADAKRWAGTPGVSVRSCFEDWLVFLAAAAGTAPALVAVFDNPGVSSVAFIWYIWIHINHIYLVFTRNRSKRQKMATASTCAGGDDDTSLNLHLPPNCGLLLK
jgi:hypothetical protein